MTEITSVAEGEPVERPDPGGGIYHLIYLLCILVVIAFAVWAYFGTLDIVSMATGEVVPSSQVKTVQHLEGGIVHKILVKEGTTVKQGQALVELEPTTSVADVGELEVRLRSLRLDIVRLEAEKAGDKPPVFSEKMRRAHPELVSQALDRFKVHRKRLEDDLKRQLETIVQRKQDIREIRNQKKTLVLLSERVDISTSLLKDNLTNRYNHLTLLKDKGDVEARIEEDGVGLIRARAALKEALAARELIYSNFSEKNGTELNEARTSLAELGQRMEKFRDSLKRTIVRSPVEGVIKTLNVVTVGGVLKPGDPIAEVVPAGDRLIIEAKLPPQDIGYVQVGQKVVIKLASADAARLGGLDGKVITVSPDTLVMDDGTAFYKVRINTEADHFEHGSIKYNLFPGMQVVANIETGHRTIFEYLISPLVSQASSALQER